MTKEKYREVIKSVVLMSIGEIYHGLERLTKELDKDLPSLGAGEMREYAEARDAIERYGLALRDGLNSLNKHVTGQRK